MFDNTKCIIAFCKNTFLKQILEEIDFLKKTCTNQNNIERKRFIVLNNPISMLEEKHAVKPSVAHKPTKSYKSTATVIYNLLTGVIYNLLTTYWSIWCKIRYVGKFETSSNSRLHDHRKGVK